MSLIKPQDLIDEFGVEGLCATADVYFEGFQLDFEQMRKPFSNLGDAPRLLRNLGTLLEGLDLCRGLTVLDFGAGTCWLSRYLAQMGCATVSVDPSAKALDLGRQWFERHPPALMPKDPVFSVFNGRTLDVPDESVDRVICFDAFHHVPNPEEVIAEFARVLRPGGIAGFSEPGPHHSKTQQSQMEMREFKVLENDIRVEELERYALAAGFTNAWVELGFVDDRIPLSTGEVAGIANRRRLLPLRPLMRLIRAAMGTLRNQHFLYLAKGKPERDSRWAEGLAHQLRLVSIPSSASVGDEIPFQIEVKNAGASRWIRGEPADVGNVNLALSTRAVEPESSAQEIQRFRLPRSLAAGESLVFEGTFSWSEPGLLPLQVDLVSEQVAWFEQRGSQPVQFEIEVRS